MMMMMMMMVMMMMMMLYHDDDADDDDNDDDDDDGSRWLAGRPVVPSRDLGRSRSYCMRSYCRVGPFGPWAQWPSVGEVRV